MTSSDDAPPLLPTFQDKFRNQQLRSALEVLRDRADGDLRIQLQSVLNGQGSLRDLARTRAFESFVEPLAQQSYERFDSLSQSEKETLASQYEQARADFERNDEDR